MDAEPSRGLRTVAATGFDRAPDHAALESGNRRGEIAIEQTDIELLTASSDASTPIIPYRSAKARQMAAHASTRTLANGQNPIAYGRRAIVWKLGHIASRRRNGKPDADACDQCPNARNH
jgi:hypothetical protein